MSKRINLSHPPKSSIGYGRKLVRWAADKPLKGKNATVVYSTGR